MKPFDIGIEKTNAILKYQRLQKLTTLFRFIEILIFLFMISNLSSQLPFSIKLSKDYFKGITFMLFSPKFVFVIGNMIILILFLKSRVHENNECMGNNTDLSYEYVEKCHFVKSSTAITPTTFTTSTSDVNNVATYSNVKKMCRRKSDNRIKVKCEDTKSYGELRRLVTEKFGCHGGDMMVMEKTNVIKDELSCEDFRKTVEAFIARQQKILRDEEFSPMVYIGS